MPTSPDRARAPKRHHSHQRELILAWLCEVDTHPTARQVHAALLAQLPDLSLGTVYRNLEVLVADGNVDEVVCAGGAARYDANVAVHHHFHCESCDRILDVELPAPRGLSKKLEGTHGLRARRTSISFFGLCPDCEVQHEAKRRQDGAGRDARRSPQQP